MLISQVNTKGFSNRGRGLGRELFQTQMGENHIRHVSDFQPGCRCTLGCPEEVVEGCHQILK